MRLALLDVNKGCKNILEVPCPVSKYSNLIWLGFSEEGQLFSYDGEGIIRCLNMETKNWTPILDFKMSYPHIMANQMWIVGICEQEVLAIELPKGYAAPH